MQKFNSSELKAILQDTTRKIEAADGNRQINAAAETLVTTLLDSEFASLWVFDEMEASLRRARGEEQVCEISMLDQRGVLAKSFLTLTGGIYNYLASEKEYCPETDNPDEIRMKSKIILPLINDERLLGIVTAYSSVRHKQNFDEDDMEMLETVAPFLINVIYRMYPEKQTEEAPEIYLSERLKESSHAISRQIEENEHAHPTPATSDETLMFLANTVHDIRTPANALFGFLELLEGQVDNARLLQYVRNAKESARFINELTTSILDRVSTQRERTLSKPVRITSAKFFADIAAIFSANMSDKALAYPVYIDPALPKEITVDAAKLKRVIINLVGNAYKFTPTGRSVELAVVYDPNGGTMKIAVTDTGIGIAEEHQQAIFKAFEQATDETAATFGGTGLGLAISAQYVHDLGGKLELESETDKGSRFFFTLPLQSANAAPSFAAPKNPGSKIAILMDEANLPTSKNIMRYLLRMGLPKSNIIAIRSVVQTPSDATHLIAFQRRYDEQVRAYAKENNLSLTVMEERFLSMTKTQKAAGVDVISQYGYYASTLHAMLSSRGVPKVLVADDDRINIELIKAILEEEFCEIETAQDGQSAIDLLAKGILDDQPYALLLLDNNMPKISGNEVVRELRAIEKQHSLPPAYVVSISGDPKAAASDNPHFDAYVGKPFNKKEIKRMLKAALAAGD
ncbi:ATP-binding protein [Sulfurimonas sp. ST-25]|uniref:hybrid sensor histidine kinase/response regulator n=1 Tax=Sulfurimonas sp. ST-25 TaxID=3400151 RepID=UPI003A86A974